MMTPKHSSEPSWAKHIVPELELSDDLPARREIWDHVHRDKRRRVLYWLGKLVWIGPVFWVLYLVGLAIHSGSGSTAVFRFCVLMLTFFLVRW